ncbi:MAG: ABC transporter permease [Bifidobacteriaceae bacterium]|jgi:oligopeptide transport system permease protein|nr:ABC transporter permease [Bifidobacteriaceae bacterium]
MTRYALSRTGQAIVVIFAATLLLFALVYAMPGDPVAALAGENAVLDAATRAKISAKYHLDQPFFVQYLIYLGNVFQGDLGETFAGRPVTEIIARVFPATARLTVLTVAIQSVVGIALGMIAGRRRGTGFDGGIMVVTMVLVGVPTFVSAFVIQYFLGVKWGWVKPTVSAQATWLELIVPAVVLALGSLAFLIRFTRSGIGDAMGSEHVRAARARGLPEWRVALFHVLRNALIPIVTVIGTEFGALLGGAVITESVFNIPGYGQQVYRLFANEGVVVIGGGAASLV